MDFEFTRFLTAHRYWSSTPLKSVVFHVKVWRAPLVEENSDELLCAESIMWETKIPSPAETLDLLQRASEMAAPTLSMGDESPGEAGSAGMLAGQSPGGGLGSSRGSALWPDTNEEEREEAVSGAELLEHLSRPESCLFTRPASEDYIDEAEEACPVEPPMGRSRLAGVVLRHHRTGHRPNLNMYLMWASGDVIVGDANARDVPADRLNVEDMKWCGIECVMCAITADPSEETAFVVKPSLNDVHTLFVDSLYLYKFCVTAPVGSRSGYGPIGDVEGLPRVMTENLLERIRILTQRMREREDIRMPASVEQQHRALLRQALGPTAHPPANVVPRGAEENGREATAVSSGRGSSVGFTAPPSSGMRRYHIFGTIEKIVGIDMDTVFLLCEWMRPDDAAFDAKSNFRAGLVVQETFTSQVAYAARECRPDFTFATTFTLNLPFEYHMLESSHPAPNRLRLALTAYTKGSSADALQAAVGYGVLVVPLISPGCHRDVQVSLWRPKMTGSEYLHSTFIGGAPAFADMGYPSLSVGTHRNSEGPTASLFQRLSGALSLHRDGTARAGLLTNPAGTVEINVMVAVQQHVHGYS